MNALVYPEGGLPYEKDGVFLAHLRGEKGVFATS